MKVIGVGIIVISIVSTSCKLLVLCNLHVRHTTTYYLKLDPNYDTRSRIGMLAFSCW